MVEICRGRYARGGKLYMDKSSFSEDRHPVAPNRLRIVVKYNRFRQKVGLYSLDLVPAVEEDLA